MKEINQQLDNNLNSWECKEKNKHFFFERLTGDDCIEKKIHKEGEDFKKNPLGCMKSKIKENESFCRHLQYTSRLSLMDDQENSSHTASKTIVKCLRVGWTGCRKIAYRGKGVYEKKRAVRIKLEKKPTVLHRRGCRTFITRR